MTALATPPKLQFLDANGAPLVGGKLYTYTAGTTTPQASYTDYGGGTANANPVILDSRGEANVWLGTALYKMALYSATNVLIWTVDNIGGFATLAQLAASGGSNLVGFIQSGAGAVATTVQAKLRESVSVKDFGAVGNGVADDTAAIQAAVDAADANRANEIYFPVGEYVISGTITLASGIRLIGQGAMGAQVSQGAVLVHKANSVNMLLWNGSNPATARGVGGGIFNMQCVKGVGYSGGDAIKLLATSDSLRPGEFTIENVLVWQGNGGNWSRGLHVDGTAANTPGSKGVRSIKMDKLRVADCSVNNEYIYLNQAVHVVSEYLQIDTGSGTGTCGMTIAADSENIILNGLILNGNLIIGGSSAMNVVLNGRIAVLDVNNTLVVGSANIETNGLTSAAPNFSIVSNLNDAFLAVLTSNIANVTGDNTNYSVAFDTELYDKNNSFSSTTFTAKLSGRYSFKWCFGFTGLTSSHTRQDSGILHTRSAATVNSVIKVSNPYAQGSNSGLNFSESGSIDLLVLEGDTVTMDTAVSGGAKVVDLLGSAGTRYTWFAGVYLP